VATEPPIQMSALAASGEQLRARAPDADAFVVGTPSHEMVAAVDGHEHGDEPGLCAMRFA